MATFSTFIKHLFKAGWFPPASMISDTPGENGSPACGPAQQAQSSVGARASSAQPAPLPPPQEAWESEQGDHAGLHQPAHVSAWEPRPLF